MSRVWWFVAGVLSTVVLAAICAVLYLEVFSHGLSARQTPSSLEKEMAEHARSMAMPAAAKERRNPVPASPEVLHDAMAHWADHCATCHANDGSGKGEMSQMYPRAPDMREKDTQGMTDGELFYVIENGIRFSGMPAWGGGDHGEADSWKLVHFIRHLPKLSTADLEEMKKLNPKTLAERAEEQQEQQFLDGQTPPDALVAPHHH